MSSVLPLASLLAKLPLLSYRPIELNSQQQFCFVGFVLVLCVRVGARVGWEGVGVGMSGGGQHGVMKPTAVYGQEVVADDLGLASASMMEVDMDGDSLDRCLTDASQLGLDHKPTDADFFDAFEDDFDDSDLL